MAATVPASRATRRRVCAWAACAASLLSACKSDSGSAASASASAPASAPTPAPNSAPIKLAVPSGPRLAVLPGQGIGAIRLGATLPTVERNMEAPCDEKTATLCRYVARAVEFELGPEGKVTRIRAHATGRKVPGGDRTYGMFNGGIPPDLRFGMIVPAVQQFLGPPVKVEQGNAGAAPEAIEQHRYQGMVLEYDLSPGGKPVLAGIRIPD